MWQIMLLCALSAAATLAGAFFFAANYPWIDFSPLEQQVQGTPSMVLDCHGNEWFRFRLDKREPVSLAEMPQHLIDAFLAAEDWQFFKHPGVSLRGIIRSTCANLYHRRRVQGASTITQQLVKLLFLDARKTFSRKIKEQICSLLVERQFTKEQILETYLNNIYLGCGIYGVQAACQRFWGTHVTDISIDQAAVLAAIIRSPARYCPLRDPVAARRRRDLILNSMRTLGFISGKQYEESVACPVEVQAASDEYGMHMRESIRLMLEQMLGRHELYTGGYIIKTTIDPAMQKAAELSFRQQCEQLRKKHAPDVDGALLSIEVATGQIRAAVGGFDFAASKFNRALQACRQVGSVFKPLVYAAALEAGLSFADTMVDEPLELMCGGRWWRPKNWDAQFTGEITLARALSFSSNIVTIKTLMAAGIERVIALAKRCHVAGPFNLYPSLALGCVDATLPEVAGMFNVFANNGVYAEPHVLLWVKDRWGAKQWRHQPQQEQAMPARLAGQVSKVLGIGFQRVRKRFVTHGIDSQVISKTGTTNDWRTVWFAGSTPSVTTAMYVGRDSNKPMGANAYPLKVALPVWLAYHGQVPSPIKQFSYDPSLQEKVINGRTGRPASSGDPDAITILL